VTITFPAVLAGAGKLRASLRTQVRMVTSLTPSKRAIEQKLMLPIA
jgi:hypothetical protein